MSTAETAGSELTGDARRLIDSTHTVWFSRYDGRSDAMVRIFLRLGGEDADLHLSSGNWVKDRLPKSLKKQLFNELFWRVELTPAEWRDVREAWEARAEVVDSEEGLPVEVRE